jgi:hypothetical protein
MQLSALPKRIDSFNLKEFQPSLICPKILESVECMEPYRGLILNCSKEAFVTLALMEEMCQDNGFAVAGRQTCPKLPFKVFI